jgi:thiol-disulfide isomerase/thioredoxin
MKPLFLTLLLGAASLFAADPAAGTAQVPRKAPELTIQLPGKQLLLSNFKGYTVVLAFMSTTCPHCQHLATVMAGLQPEYAPKGIQMLGVVFNAEANTDLPNFSRAFARGAFPVGMSTDPIVTDFVQHPQGIHYIPMMVFIDKNGVIRSQHLAINDSNYFKESDEVQNIKNDIEAILKEPAIKLPAAAPKKK